MRGLTGPRSTRTRSTVRAATTATAVLAAVVLFAGGCGTGGTGARDEGPAHADSVASAAAPSAPPSGTPNRIDAVRLVKADPAVSAEVKRELKPCVADEYPVDVSYGNLTGGAVDDVVVNVLTCGDAVGVGSYVYRDQGGAFVNVFTAEDTPVYAEIDRGDLVVTKQVYDRGDPLSSPSGENVITYRWATDRFDEEYRTHNDYGQVAGAQPSPMPEG
ncbi:lipoprotein CseA [Streptomyces malachitofuscus]|nr:lipoprotein CseA [Streptomyces malachitofuscus]